MPEQYDAFLEVMRTQAAGYLETTLALMEMTWEKFREHFLSVGEVLGIYAGEQLAGFYWIELRERVLHIHALMVLPSHQGRGIGTEILRRLEVQHRGQATHVEMGVHDSNPRAKVLYERLGYRTFKVLKDLGFEVLRKPLVP